MSSNDLMTGHQEHRESESLPADLMNVELAQPDLFSGGDAASHEVGTAYSGHTSPPSVNGMPDGYMHPNEGDEDMTQYGDDRSPFSPFSPEFVLGLTEDDVVEPFVAVPGVQGHKSTLMLSPQEREAELQRVLQELSEKGEDSDPVILEFGPLAALEARLRGVTADLADDDVARVVTAKLRQLIHEAVVSNPYMGDKWNTQEGLAARREAVEDINDSIDAEIEPMLTNIESTGLKLTGLRTALKNTIQVEQRLLLQLEQSLAPPTIGNLIFEGLSQLKDSFTSTASGKLTLKGDVRRFRNEQVSRALADLVEISGEIRSNAGNAEWERTEGPMALKLAGELSSNIKTLTKGVEDQVDYSLVNRALGESALNISQAAELASDDSHKEGLKKMLDFMHQAMEAFANIVKKALGVDIGVKPRAPAPP